MMLHHHDMDGAENVSLFCPLFFMVVSANAEQLMLQKIVERIDLFCTCTVYS